jgi:hypothetical protein
MVLIPEIFFNNISYLNIVFQPTILLKSVESTILFMD